MPSEEPPERTRAGLFGDIAGKTKETIGELVGNDELARDGREQQEQVQAEDEELQEKADGDETD